MTWKFVARNEQIERIRAFSSAEEYAPVVITGERGIGRTSLVKRVLRHIDRRRFKIIRIDATGDPAPFAAWIPHLPEGFPVRRELRSAAEEVARTVAEGAGGRRPMIVLDDLHHADHASMQVLRELHRRWHAFLLLTRPTGADPVRKPDPLDCLRYARGLQTLELPPLSADEVSSVLAEYLGGPMRATTTAAIHAATGGNPQLLRELVDRTRLENRLVERDGLGVLDTSIEEPCAPLRPRGEQRLLAAVRDAWRDLALECVDDLCQLAVWCSEGHRVAEPRAGVLLLRGRAEAGIRFLDTLGQAAERESRLLLTKAMLLGLGLGRQREAGALLTGAAGRQPRSRDRLLSYRAWLLAVTGQPTDATRAVTELEPATDAEAVLFARAAEASVALSTGRPADAIPKLRRALIGVQGLPTELPWLPPYLTACLIDALLLAGRGNEATVAAAEFHAGQQDCGWPVAVALSRLIEAGGPARDEPVAAGEEIRSIPPMRSAEETRAEAS
jgi:hypothetical protein